MKVRISSVMTSMILLTLLQAGAGDALAQGTLGLTVSTNQSVYHAGDKLMVSATVTNPGIAQNADIYFGMLLPNGTIQAFTDFSFHSVTCSLTSLAACQPIVRNVSLAVPFTFDQPAFFTQDWTGSDALGSYTLIAAAVLPGTLADNTADPGDLIALGTRDFTAASGTCPPVSAAYTMSLTADTQHCASIFDISGPTPCTVAQTGCSITFNCTPTVVGFGTMLMDTTGFAPFNFSQPDGRHGFCTVQFDSSSMPLKYHAFCVVQHGSQSDNCGFDATQ